MGGAAVYAAFALTVLLFVQPTRPVIGLLLGGAAAVAVVLLASCDAAERDLSCGAPSLSALPAAAFHATLRPAVDPREAVRAMEVVAARALEAHDVEALREIAAPELDVDRALLEVATTECVGSLISIDPQPPSSVVARHVLGFPDARGCTGPHEVRLGFRLTEGGLRLARVDRFGW